jgi:hypothetical protein
MAQVEVPNAESIYKTMVTFITAQGQRRIQEINERTE